METPQNQNMGTPQAHGFLKQMEDFFDTYLHKKAPFHLPPGFKEWVVKFGPWITLVLMLIALPLILAALGLTAYFNRTTVVYGGYVYSSGYAYSTTYMLEGILSLAAFVMEAVALPGLFKRSLKGWHLVYYAVLVGAVGQLVGGNIIGLIINVVVSMYFLFEIREYYK
jgi:hypothetical protein